MKKCKKGQKKMKINVLALGGKTKSKKKEKRNPKDVNRNVNNTRDDNVVVAVAAPLLAVVADALCRVYFTPSAALHPPYASFPFPLTVAHPARPCFMAEPSEAKTLAIKQKSKAPAASASADESKVKSRERSRSKQKKKKQRQQKKQSKATPVECSSNITPTLCRHGSKERARESRRGVRKEVARATATAVHIM